MAFFADSVEVQPAWQQLSRSRLFSEEQVERLRTRFATENRDSPELEIWPWLVKQGSLTEFQSLLLTSGGDGPFRFDNYLLQERISEGPLLGTYLARHITSGHPVHLDFFASELPSAQNDWQRIVDRANKLVSLSHPALVGTIEAVTLTEYAFVASELPGGQPLEQKLPRKARLPWQTAAAMGARIASALGELQRLNLVHGSISTRSIWLSGRSAVRLRLGWRHDSEFDFVLPECEESKHDYLAPEILQGQSPTMASDLYALGCVLYRLISGRSITQGVSVDDKIRAQLHATPRDLSKYEIPISLQQLINTLLLKAAAARPTDANNVARMLADISGQSLEQLLPRTEPAPSLLALRKALLSETPLVAASRPIVGPTQINVAALDERPEQAKPRTALTAEQLKTIRLKKKRRFLSTIAGAVVLFMGVLTLLAWSLSNKKSKLTSISHPSNRLNIGNATALDETQQKPMPEIAPRETNDSQSVLSQQIVADDGQMLWQSPTAGAQVDFSYLPPGPKLVLTIRPQALFADEQGQLLRQACGPGLQAVIESWTVVNGVALNDISRLVVGFYPDGNLRYRGLSIVRLSTPMPEGDLVAKWKATPVEPASGDSIQSSAFENAENYFLTYSSNPEPSTNGRLVEMFVSGPKDLATSAAEMATAKSLSGPLATICQFADEQRHFNLLFIPPALFNDEGQWLMSGVWAPLNRPLRIILDESIRAGLLSFHFDQGCYFELVLDGSVDIKPNELRSQLANRIKAARDEATQALTEMTASPYWERVHLKFDNMLADVNRHFRTGVEQQNVIANGWLPPMAAHNLVASTELALALGHVAIAEDVADTPVPQTLEDLLATPRSLKVTTNPDLNVLLQNIAAEVNEQYAGMPFKFRIELLGNDLAKEGITQNQRPGDFSANQEPLSNILTQIMFRANPDKSATSSHDSKCKLLWIIAEDPANPGQKLVQVTTRVAATERNLPIPPDFQEQK